jgi:hypothetical protein
MMRWKPSVSSGASSAVVVALPASAIDDSPPDVTF